MTDAIVYEKGREADTRWGHWIVTHDVKKNPETGRPVECHKDITVNPGASLSAQLHWGRGERYTGLAGVTGVYVNGHVFTLNEGESVDVPRGSIHFSWNDGAVQSKFHEIQSGPLCDEADILRCADKYKRQEELDDDHSIVSLLLKIAKDRFEAEADRANMVAHDFMSEVVSRSAAAANPENPFDDESYVDGLNDYFHALVGQCKKDHDALTPERVGA